MNLPFKFFDACVYNFKQRRAAIAAAAEREAASEAASRVAQAHLKQATLTEAKETLRHRIKTIEDSFVSMGYKSTGQWSSGEPFDNGTFYISSPRGVLFKATVTKHGGYVAEIVA